VVPIYYAFRCQPIAMCIYLGLLLATDIACVFVTFNPRFEKPGYEAVRAGVFVGIGMLLLCSSLSPPLTLLQASLDLACCLTCSFSMDSHSYRYRLLRPVFLSACLAYTLSD
jgi:hypothetical protein